MLTKPCKECGGPALVRQPSRFERTKFCSFRCNGISKGRREAKRLHEEALRRRIPVRVQPADYRCLVVNSGKTVKVSIEDFDALAEILWHLNDRGYAVCDRSPRRLHRVVVERMLRRRLGADEQVDHINGDRLDCRRMNLRATDNQHNAFNRGSQANNTSGFKGVSRCKTVSETWEFGIKCSDIRIRWGGFKTPAEAAWMYDQTAIALHGDFAFLNFEYEETPS